MKKRINLERVLAACRTLDLRALAHCRAGHLDRARRAWRAADRIHFRALHATR